MFGGSTTKDLKKNAVSSKDLAVALAKDRKFRKQLRSAVKHGSKARRRAVPRAGMVAVGARLASDDKLRNELKQTADNLQQAWQRVEKKRSHRLRNVLVAIGLGALGAKLFRSRGQVAQSIPGVGGTAPRTISDEIEVGVPVSTAYNQWTQFEDFPLFMEGVEDVKQLDDTRLHWVASVGGKRAEWDAKILEQHPDRQISWISEDGKKTRGTVSFESRGDKTLIRLSMSYQAEGPIEQLGSAAGLDQRRVRSDLERFKELIESRGTESGAWRGEVSAGSKE
jgi:uncharacterized membrane protein